MVAEDTEEHDFVLFVSGLRFTAQTDLIGRVNAISNNADIVANAEFQCR